MPEARIRARDPATGWSMTGKTVLFFWTDKPVTVQIIVGYDAKPAS